MDNSLPEQNTVQDKDRIDLLLAKKEHDNRVIPLIKWPDFHPWPSIEGLRYIVKHAHYNGFNTAIIRAGSRVLISEQAFFNWLQERNGQPLGDPDLYNE